MAAISKCVVSYNIDAIILLNVILCSVYLVYAELSKFKRVRATCMFKMSEIEVITSEIHVLNIVIILQQIVNPLLVIATTNFIVPYCFLFNALKNLWWEIELLAWF